MKDKNGHITRLRDPYSFGRFDKSEVIFNKFAAGTEYNAYNLLGNKVCEKTAFQVCFLEHGHLMRYE